MPSKSSVNLRSQLYPSMRDVTLRQVHPPPAPRPLSSPYTEFPLGAPSESWQSSEAKVGDVFGPSWATHWFRIDLETPPEWEGKEVRRGGFIGFCLFLGFISLTPRFSLSLSLSLSHTHTPLILKIEINQKLGSFCV